VRLPLLLLPGLLGAARLLLLALLLCFLVE
jgi:hypothetical protein